MNISITNEGEDVSVTYYKGNMKIYLRSFAAT